MKKILTGIIISVLFTPICFGYFEYKFYCNVSGDSIYVSQKNKVGYTKCISLVNQINSQINDVVKSLNEADVYISRDEDIDFRKGVKSNLNKQKLSLESIKPKILFAMTKFEEDLFIKVDKALDFYLKVELRKLQKEKVYYDDGLAYRIQSGAVKEYKVMQEKKDDVMIEITMIEKMIETDSFEVLIPLLKTWYNYFYKQ